MSDYNSRHNRAVWFDIPVSDLDRAATFYAAVLGVGVTKEAIDCTELADCLACPLDQSLFKPLTGFGVAEVAEADCAGLQGKEQGEQDSDGTAHGDLQINEGTAWLVYSKIAAMQIPSMR